MELLLIRTYYPNGTNGILHSNADTIPICYTIELPWCNNKPRESCIEEGRYEIRKRYSPKHGHHFQIANVPGRNLILIHPANDALKELKGCIAPVTVITGQGKGSSSRLAMQQLSVVIGTALKIEPVYLTIKNNQHDNQRKNTGANTAIL